MKELALHILDIAENSIAAGATYIHISVDEDRLKNILGIVVQDNGRGVPKEKIADLTDPFVTSRTTRKIGLGLSLLEAAAQRSEGRISIASEPGKGTTVTATFGYDHIDRAPLGNMAETIAAMVAGNPEIDFVYTHTVDGKTFNLDTRKIMKEVSEACSKVALFVTQTIHQSLERLNRDNSAS